MGTKPFSQWWVGQALPSLVSRTPRCQDGPGRGAHRGPCRSSAQNCSSLVAKLRSESRPLKCRLPPLDRATS